MVTAVLALITALLAALPQILRMLEARTVKKDEVTSALLDRDIDVLRTELDRLRKPPGV